MADGLPDISSMLQKISENPAAAEMLASILGSKEQGEQGEGSEKSGGAPSAPPADVPVGLSLPPSKLKHGQKRRETLLALRPYLGARRAASLDRMIRALELYEIIEETHLLKGGK